MKILILAKNIPFISTGSIVAMQWGDGRLWMCGSVVIHGTEDHNGRSYKIKVTMTGYTIKRKKRHIKATTISAEDYLRNEKANQPQTNDKFNKLVDCFAQVHKHEQSNEMQMERKDMMANTHTIQPPRDINL